METQIENQQPLQQAMTIIGGPSAMARACKVSPQAVCKWEKAGRLPRTDWTGETNYSEIIERETLGKVTRAQLLQLPAKPATAHQASDPAQVAA